MQPALTMRNEIVTVFGGSGFLGRHVVAALARQGYRIRVAVRRPDNCGFLKPLGLVGQIQAVQANLRYPASVVAAVEGASAVVNCVGILFESGAQRFKSVQDEGARTLAAAARDAGVPTFIHVSAIGANAESASSYAVSKASAEQHVLACNPRAIILRPSIIFGPEDKFFNKFAALARFLPFLPLIGGGMTKFQPVYVCDVADAVVAGVQGKAQAGQIYELGGPQVKTFKQLLQLVLEMTLRKRLLVPLPFFAAKIQAMFMQLLPNPVLTVDQVELLQSDNIVSEEAKREQRTLDGLGIAPTALRAVLPSYLWPYRTGGEFAQSNALVEDEIEADAAFTKERQA